MPILTGKPISTIRSGFLCLNKPQGITSRDAVNTVQRVVRPAKVGHTGTLDPLATGVLVVAIGSATRLVRFVQDQPKHYRGTFQLGLTTDTDDITGTERTADALSGSPEDHLARARAVTPVELKNVLHEFVGRISQVPPQFSAVHVDGRRAYDLARHGIEVELAPRPVTIYSMQLVEFTPPVFVLDVTCSGGTYIRSLGRDIGQRLGCGAVMVALERTAVGPFTIRSAVSPDQMTREVAENSLWPLSTAVEHLPGVNMDAQQIAAIHSGQGLPNPAGLQGEVALLDSAGELAGIAEAVESRLQPRIVLRG